MVVERFGFLTSLLGIPLCLLYIVCHPVKRLTERSRHLPFEDGIVRSVGHPPPRIKTHGDTRIVGEIAPPLAAYCRLYAVVAPADADVVNTTGLATDAIAGHSLLVRGKQRAGPDGEWQPFTITSDAARPIELEAIDANTGKSPLVLDSPQATAMMLIDKVIGPAVFRVDPAAKDAGAHIIDRLGERMRVHRF